MIPQESRIRLLAALLLCSSLAAPPPVLPPPAALTPGTVADTSGSLCVDGTEALLCLSWAITGPNIITFTATCRPPPGQKQLFWCAFGLSNASATTMFPAEVTALQLDPASGRVSLEDRDSFVGYQSPPCYATQLSQLLPGARGGANGSIIASWTRPLRLAPALLSAHYLDIEVGAAMTVIGALSADTGAAAGVCAPEMQLHSLCAPGVRVEFGGPAAGGGA